MSTATGASDPTPSAAVEEPQSGDAELPLLDLAVIQELDEELGESSLSRTFALDYASLWEQRRNRLARSLEREDVKAALDSVISLKVSSAMVGAVRLAHLAAQLEAAVRKGYSQEMTTLLAVIALHGTDTVSELLRWSATSPGTANPEEASPVAKASG